LSITSSTPAALFLFCAWHRTRLEPGLFCLLFSARILCQKKRLNGIKRVVSSSGALRAPVGRRPSILRFRRRSCLSSSGRWMNLRSRFSLCNLSVRMMRSTRSAIADLSGRRSSPRLSFRFKRKRWLVLRFSNGFMQILCERLERDERERELRFLAALFWLCLAQILASALNASRERELRLFWLCFFWLCFFGLGFANRESESQKGLA